MGKLVLKIPRKKKKIDILRDIEEIKSVLGNRRPAPLKSDEDLSQEEIEQLMLRTKNDDVEYEQDEDDFFIKPKNKQEVHVVEEEDDDKQLLDENVDEDILNDDEDILNIDKHSDDDLENIEEDKSFDDNEKAYDNELGEMNHSTDKPCYSEVFTISDSNQPIEVSIKNVKDESIAIEEFKKEIQDAYDKGFLDGQDTARPPLETEIIKLQSWLKSIDRLTRNIKLEYLSQLNELENTIAPLAVMIAEKIIQKETSRDSRIIINRVRNIMQKLEGEKLFEISANPDDIEILKAIGSNLLDDPELSKQIKFVPDRSIDPGGCKLQTSAGQIDATIESQLEEIARNIDNHLPDKKLSDEEKEIIAQSAIDRDEEETFDFNDDFL